MRSIEDFFDEEEGMTAERKRKRERIKSLTLAELGRELNKDFPFTADGIWEQAELLHQHTEKQKAAGIYVEYIPKTKAPYINPRFPTVSEAPIYRIPSPEETRLEDNMLLWTHLYYDREIDYRGEYYDREKEWY